MSITIDIVREAHAPVSARKNGRPHRRPAPIRGIPRLYRGLDLGSLPPYANTTYPTGLNEIGQIVGYAYQPGFRHREGFLWTPGGTDGPSENPQLRANHPTFGPDGWIYLAAGLSGGLITSPEYPKRPPLKMTADVRFHPDTLEVENVDALVRATDRFA